MHISMYKMFPSHVHDTFTCTGSCSVPENSTLAGSCELTLCHLSCLLLLDCKLYCEQIQKIMVVFLLFQVSKTVHRLGRSVAELEHHINHSQVQLQRMKAAQTAMIQIRHKKWLPGEVRYKMASAHPGTCSDSAPRRDAGGHEQPTYALRLPPAHLRTDLNDSIELATERKYLSIVNEDTPEIDGKPHI